MSKTYPPVIILGMHRSGTSCLAGSLQQAGLVLGDVHTANPFNKKGNREHPALMALHEQVLESNGGAWHNPPERVEWQEAHRQRRDDFVRGFAGVRQWGFKDPRALMALDGWLEVFPEARFVGTIRHPLAVARSLYKRNPKLCTMDDYVALWARYNRRLLALWGQYRFPVLDFDSDDADYLAALTPTMAELGLKEGFWHRVRRTGLVPALKGRMAGREQPFFDPALRSQRQAGTEGLPPEVVRLYDELKGIAR